MRQLPLKIRKEPYIDTTVEIRFESEIDKSAVFGVVYFALKDTYTRVEQLPMPTLQFDEANSFNGLSLAAHFRHRIYSEKFNLQISGDSISIHCNEAYWGWTEYSKEILRVISIIKEIKIIRKITRLGLRYINFFPDNVNIFKNLEMRLAFSKKDISDYPASIRVFLPEDEFVTQLQIANLTEVERKGETVIGSVIDIDTICDTSSIDFFTLYDQLINKAHQIEKNIFFDLFTDEYLKYLEPVYNDRDSN